MRDVAELDMKLPSARVTKARWWEYAKQLPDSQDVRMYTNERAFMKDVKNRKQGLKILLMEQNN